MTIIFAKDGVDKWVHSFDMDNYGPAPGGIGNPTASLVDVPGSPDRHTHTVETVLTKSAVFGSTDDAVRVYFGYKQTTPTETLGSYLHNPGATMTDIVSGLTGTTAAPSLLATTMEVVAKRRTTRRRSSLARRAARRS